MSNPKSFNMAVSIKRRVEEVKFYPGFRTIEQFETVRNIVEGHDFDFSCSSKLFTPDSISDRYKGPFCFSWYDTNQVLHFTYVGKKGEILTGAEADKLFSRT